VDTDPITLYRDAAAAFTHLVDDVAGADWSAPTGCPGWTVRDLVRHVVGALAAAGDGRHRTVQLSVGDTPAGEYAMQLFADHLVHAWDLATALGRPDPTDPAHVRAALDWFGPHEAAYRAAGLVGPRPPLPAGADDLTTLLAACGRTP
jgi:hypothetical protein